MDVLEQQEEIVMNAEGSERILCRVHRKSEDSNDFEEAIFHGWVDRWDMFSKMLKKYLIGKIAYGVVEYMDGTVERVRFEDIQFTDTEGIIQKATGK